MAKTIEIERMIRMLSGLKDNYVIEIHGMKPYDDEEEPPVHHDNPFDCYNGVILDKVILKKKKTMEKEYRHWQVVIKEVFNPKTITTEVHGNYDENGVVKFLGLKNEDIEWYKLKEL